MSVIADPGGATKQCHSLGQDDDGLRLRKRRRANRHSWNDAGSHVGHRGLHPRISRSVAVATPPLAVKRPGNGARVLQPTRHSRHCEPCPPPNRIASILGVHRLRPRHIIQFRHAVVNLTDHPLREWPEVHIQRHQHHDVTQRAWIGFGDFDEGLPERPANLR